MSRPKNILITGTKSGLGAYLAQNLKPFCWTRDTSDQDIQKWKSKGVDVIVHCAFPPARQFDSDHAKQCSQEAIQLTQNILEVPHQQFIFISSVDVYPDNDQWHDENEVLSEKKCRSAYGITKLKCEQSIQAKSPKSCILRASAMLGPGMRPNTLIRMLQNEAPEVSLSAESVISYVQYEDMLSVIKLAIDQGLNGVYNTTSSGGLLLGDIAQLLGKRVRFGPYTYRTLRIKSDKIQQVCPAFAKTSKQVVVSFIQTYNLKH